LHVRPYSGYQEQTLAEILRDEPDLTGDLWVERVEFEASLN